MIPLTADELKTLIQARDLLQRKSNGPGGYRARTACQAVVVILRSAYLEVPVEEAK